MDYTELFTPHHIALLIDWFEEKESLCLELYFPHSASSASYFTVRSLSEIRGLIQTIKHPEIQITVWKNHTKEEFETDGPEPCPTDLKWIYTHGDEIMYLSVLKNRNWTESYHNNPEKYQKQIEEWLS